MNKPLSQDDAKMLAVQTAGSNAYHATAGLDGALEVANALTYAFVLMFEDYVERLTEEQISETMDTVKQGVLANWQYRRDTES